MIIEFAITNFKSIHQKQVFSMESNSARSRIENIFDVNLQNGSKTSLVKAAAIYGQNSSGKSNCIQALWELKKIITRANRIKIDEPISAYNPFLFNPLSRQALASFELLFIAPDKQKYKYLITFNQTEIVEERLDYFPKKQVRNLFVRYAESSPEDPHLHIAKLSKELNYRKYIIHQKLPLLSLFGKAEHYQKLISPAFSYIKSLKIENVTNSHYVELLKDTIKTDLQKTEYQWLKEKLEKLIVDCDTQIKSLQIDTDTQTRMFLLNKEENALKMQRNEIIYAQHAVFDQEKEIGTYNLPFNQESLGTNRLFALGGLILKALDKGEVVFIDELDSSLHPYISRFLVKLFLNPITNPNNAQLVFTTHESHLLDKMLRSDQIWFTEKNTLGETLLFSAQDFEGIREDIPFDKWYMAGKFGAVPQTSETNFIFNYAKENQNI